MAPRGRFELPTFRLTAERSTIELPGNVFILLCFTGGFKLQCVLVVSFGIYHALDLKRVYQGLNKLAKTGVRFERDFRQWQWSIEMSDPSSIIPRANETFSERYARLTKEGTASEISRRETMMFYSLVGSLSELAVRLIGRLVHRPR